MYVENGDTNGEANIKRGRGKALNRNDDPNVDSTSRRSGERSRFEEGAIPGETFKRGNTTPRLSGGQKIDGGSLKELIRQGEEHLSSLSVQLDLWRSMLALIESEN